MKLTKKYSIVVSPYFEWGFLKRDPSIRWNWINITPIQISFEWGSYKAPYFEMTFVLIGFGFIVEIYDTQERKEWGETMDALIDGWDKEHNSSEENK